MSLDSNNQNLKMTTFASRLAPNYIQEVPSAAPVIANFTPSSLDHTGRTDMYARVGKERAEQHHHTPTELGVLAVLHEATDEQLDTWAAAPVAQKIALEWQFPLVAYGFEAMATSESHRQDITDHLATWADLFKHVAPQHIPEAVNALQRHRADFDDRNSRPGPDISHQLFSYVRLGEVAADPWKRINRHGIFEDESHALSLHRPFDQGRGSFSVTDFANPATLEQLQAAHKSYVEYSTKPSDLAIVIQ